MLKKLFLCLLLISCSVFAMENNEIKKLDKEEEKLFVELSKEMSHQYNNDCPICLEPVKKSLYWHYAKQLFSGKSPEKSIPSIIKLSCGHRYHDDCLHQNFHQNLELNCPLCRSPFMMNDVYSSKALDLNKKTRQLYYNKNQLFDLECLTEDINEKIKTDHDRMPEFINNLIEEKKQEQRKKLWTQIYYWGKFVKFNNMQPSARKYVFDKIGGFYLMRIFLLHTFNPQSSHQGVAGAQWIVRSLGTSYDSPRFQKCILYYIPIILTALRIYTGKGKNLVDLTIDIVEKMLLK